ncbi:MAG: deaminase [Bacillota bacterium]|nr:deaminase [Bacillota bacterium]
MNNNKHELYIKKCYELAVNAGKKGYDTFGAILVNEGKILEESENTADYENGLFGHAEFNLVHKCANKYSDSILEKSILYTSCALCTRCMMAIASLGIKNIVCGVSYKSFNLLLPFEPKLIEYETIMKEMGVSINLVGPVLEDEGMKTFEYWGGNYRPIEELLEESANMRKGK